ncbi:MAG: hypothetical protein LBE24_09400 [Methylobacillus sp.]|jgi:type IV pilus assembly protein PilY1|nr:hypothetical protein [Methylobacillus sp.]
MNKKSIYKNSFPGHIRPVVQAVRTLFVLAGIAAPSLALAQVAFTQTPPMGSSSPGVMPNIIVSLDNTGSMQTYDATCIGGSDAWCDSRFNTEMRYQALMTAITNVFGPNATNNLVGRIRLAFQSVGADAGFGPNRFYKNTLDDPVTGRKFDNSMRLYDANYQTLFIQWVNQVYPFGATNPANPYWGCNPTQPMIVYAGEYLKGNWLSAANTMFGCEWGGAMSWNGTTSPNPANYLNFTNFLSTQPQSNPWNESPADADGNSSLPASASADAVADASTHLACRRSYYILMTDGGFNGNAFTVNQVRVAQGLASDNAYVNYDNSSHTLPDGQQYDVSAADPYRHIYWDGGTNINTGGTYADFAMYYWATDLTGRGTGVVDPTPTMATTANTTFTYTNPGAAVCGGMAVPATTNQTYDPYWNPQNDPATWQHMQTYTIGFGTLLLNGGADVPAGRWQEVVPGNPNANQNYCLPYGFDATYGNFFAQYATGAIRWPDTGSLDVNAGWSSIGVNMDLPHAAYNGRGRFYPATSATALQQAFQDILSIAITQTAPGSITSASASGSELTTNTMAYVSSYAYDESDATPASMTPVVTWGDGNPITGTLHGWSGALKAYSANDTNTAASTPVWTASILSSRNIFTADRINGDGLNFQWGGATGLNTDPLVSTILNNPKVMAIRQAPLGDIYNSQVIYVGKPSRFTMDTTYATFATKYSSGGSKRKSVVYVGANDGMLHGFDAGDGTSSTPGTGTELMAYIPRGLLPELEAFTTTPLYTHRFWVDGSPFSGDAQTGTSTESGKWATVLVNTLGAGGKGYFVLDVTNPATFEEAGNKFQKDVLIDATEKDSAFAKGISAAQWDMIGNQFSQPVMEQADTTQSAQIVQINDQDTSTHKYKWAAIMGNGYNNASGFPVLLIQTLATDMKLYTISGTCVKNGVEDSTGAACKIDGNGLSAPRPIDVDGNGTVDLVYAGDLEGNLWKFNISSSDSGQWTVANGSGTSKEPLFSVVSATTSAAFPGGIPQAITGAPVAVPHPRGGYMVVFGTGKNLTDADQLSMTQNSIYAVYDDELITVDREVVGKDATMGKISQVLLGSGTNIDKAYDKGNTTNFHSSPIPSDCRSGTGASRYGVCLYEQGEGVLTPAGDVSVGVSTTNTDGCEMIDNSVPAAADFGTDCVAPNFGHYYGWYYDIPEEANGNMAKILSNPMVGAGNTLMFYSENVASAEPSNSGTDVATAANDQLESCNASTASGAKVTLNYFDIYSGGYANGTISVIIDGVLHTYLPGEGNRFQTDVNTYIRFGNTMAGVGDKGVTITNNAPVKPGRRAGWRIAR